MGGGMERVREYSIEFTVLTISGPVILCKIIFTHKVEKIRGSSLYR